MLQLLDATIRYFIYDKNFTKFTRFCYWRYPFTYRCKNFSWRKVTKFWLGDETFARQNVSRLGNFFSEICCDAIKNTHCYQFLCEGLNALPWKIFPRISWIWLSLVKLHSLKILKNVDFKIILISKNSSCKYIATRWVLSRIDSWGLSGSLPNPWKKLSKRIAIQTKKNLAKFLEKLCL